LAALSVGGYLVDRRRDAAVLPEGAVIKIGVIVPTQGPGALLGSSFLKAVQLAKEDLRGTRYRYELVIEDTGINPVQTRRAIQKLIGVDKVQAIVGGISLPGQVVKPYASYAKIPHLCVCSVSSIGDGVYNFTNIPLPQDESTRWVEEAQKRGIKTVALLTQDYPSIDGHVKALKEEAAKRGIRITYANRFAGSTTDFGSMIARARISAPDLYFVEATEPALDILGQQLNNAQIHNIASIVALSVSNRPELFEGAWYTDSNLVDAGFKKRFEQKYPDTRFATHMMPYAYDSFNLVVQGFESGQGAVEYIRGTTEYDGTPGRVTREPGSGNFRSRPAVWTIKNGKPELLY
jgi:ABC-type branched-subunit amino acid transport system substrate-binding protein